MTGVETGLLYGLFAYAVLNLVALGHLRQRIEQLEQREENGN